MNSVVDRPYFSPARTTSTDGAETRSAAQNGLSTSSSPPPVQAPPVPALARLNADQENITKLASLLRKAHPDDDGKTFSVWLKTEQGVFQAHPDSTIALKDAHTLLEGELTNIRAEAFITLLGYKLPRSAEEVLALAHTLEQRASKPLLGKLGGGLSWPVPMPQKDQNSIISFLQSGSTDVPGLPLPNNSTGALAYLLSGSSVTNADLRDPALALKKLLDSPKALALGQALQKQLVGVPSDVSLYEYVLTAIQLGLDPESIVAADRNTVAGFDLAHADNWGQPPSVVVARLSQHLITKGRATSSSAKLAAHLLLSRVAPQFLIKDIPTTVTVGSQAWANLSIAAAAIEAERPGAVANMTFAQVMSHPNSVEGQSKSLEYTKTEVLMDWGVANGIIVKNAEDTYSTAQVDTVRTAFNQQLNDRLSATQSLDKEIPTRKDIALAKLKERFGDFGELFEKKVLGTDQYKGTAQQTGLVGMHSLLDIAMMDLPNPRPFTSDDPRIPLDDLNKNLRFGVQEEFERKFSSVLDEKKAAVNTTVRHLISQLPLEDRKNFEFGKITFFQNGSYTVGMGFF